MDHRLKCLGMAIGIFLVPVSLGAQPKPGVTPSLALDACLKGKTDDREMATCGLEELARQKKSMDAAYAALLSKLSKPSQTLQRKALQEAQKSWIAYRDAECRYQYEEAGGGSIADVVSATCRWGMTADRAKSLEASLKFLSP